jgi:hypothetical protein
MKKHPLLLASALALLSACGPSAEDIQKLKESVKRSPDDTTAGVLPNVDHAMDLVNSARVEDGVVFIVDGVQYTFRQQETEGMYFKSIEGNAAFNFIADDRKSSLELMLDDFGSIKEPKEIALSGNKTGRSNFVMYIPSLEPGEKPPVAFASVKGHITITEIDWNKNYVSGTFEASDFENDGTPKVAPSFKAIKGTFYKCRFKAL